MTDPQRLPEGQPSPTFSHSPDPTLTVRGRPVYAEPAQVNSIQVDPWPIRKPVFLLASPATGRDSGPIHTGSMVIVGQALRMDYSHWSWGRRVAINLIYILGSLLITLLAF